MAQEDRTPTFDEELFSSLGDEPTQVRAADAARIREIAAEFAHGSSATRARS